MSYYTCNTCSYRTTVKSNFMKHIRTQKHIDDTKNIPHNREIVIKNLIPENEVITSKNIVITDSLGISISKEKPSICEYCSKQFTSKTNYYRHKRKFCKGSQQIINPVKPTNDLTQLEGQIKNMELEDDVKDSLLNVLNNANTQNILNTQAPLNSITNTDNDYNSNNNHHNVSNSNHHNINNNINNSNNNSNNNVNQNIVVNQFGKESWDHVHNDNMFGMLKHPRTMIVEAFKRVNLDPNQPQNHNILRHNKKDGKVQIKENGEWVSKPGDETMNTVMDDKYYSLDTFYNDMKERNPDMLKANMLPSEIATYETFSKQLDRETNLENINNPEKQPIMNESREQCYYALNDFMVRWKKQQQEEKEAKLAAEKAKKAAEREAKRAKRKEEEEEKEKARTLRRAERRAEEEAKEKAKMDRLMFRKKWEADREARHEERVRKLMAKN